MYCKEKVCMNEYDVYIGCKVIEAKRMSKREFAIAHNRENVKKEDNASGYCVKYPDGYISWSPKETFERAYRVMSQEEKRLI